MNKDALKENSTSEEGVAKTLIVPKGAKVKPQVEEFLKERQIELIYEDPDAAPRKDPKADTVKRKLYGPDGGIFEHKPESLTQLKGAQLVHKTHPVIIWRGQMDSLAADIIEAQDLGIASGSQKYADELQTVLEFVHRLLSCEFYDRKVEDFSLLGLDATALRERSHNPKKFYGRPHLLASYKMGALCVRLNKLRTRAREVELSAVAAFSGGPREDIVQALNRLSSFFYIMTYSYLPENFTAGSAGI